MAYTTIDDSGLYFNTVTYSGTGSSQSITGVGFQPDFVWCKARSGTYGAYNHNVFDVVRGVTKRIVPNHTNAEATVAASLTAFNADGWTGGGDNETNNSSTEYASWNWKAGTSFTNDASETGIGTIDSTGSFSNTSGFSIVTYTGTGSNGTIKHGLNTAPKTVWVKCRNIAYNWTTGWNTGSNNFETMLKLNSTAAKEDYAPYFNDTDPTSSVFSVGNASNTNVSSNTYVAYCFADVKGYSKFGEYTGNGNADGTFVYTGFKPSFVMVKRTDSADNWMMVDNKRDTYNLVDKLIFADLYQAEVTTDACDFLSNGFKARTTSTWINASGGSYIYMAVAESPFTNSGFVPNNAR